MNPNSESPPQPAAVQRKHQFSLAGILVLLLILCPGFVAIREVMNIANGGTKSWNLGVLLFVLAYAFALTFIAFRRRGLSTADQQIVRTLLWCVGRGAIFGMLYCVLLILPVVIAERIFAGSALQWIFILQVLAVGASFGAPAGGAAWLAVRHFPGSRNSKSNGDENLDVSDRIAKLIGQWGGMDALFTTQVVEAVKLAELEAQKLDCDYFGTEHLLLGLLHTGGFAAKVLTNLNVRAETIRDQIKKLVPAKPSSLSPIRLARGLPFTPTAKRAIKNAFTEAQPLKEDGHRIDVGDLLIGLISEQESVAAQVLLHHGLSLADLRLEMERLSRPVSDNS